MDVVFIVVEVLELLKFWYLFGYFMGGCIGLWVFYCGLDVKVVVFFGFMWGFGLMVLVCIFGKMFGGVVIKIGFGVYFVSGGSKEIYVLYDIFFDNGLMIDSVMYVCM